MQASLVSQPDCGRSRANGQGRARASGRDSPGDFVVSPPSAADVLDSRFA